MMIEDLNGITAGNGQDINNAQGQEYHVEDILDRPWIVLLLLGSVSLLIGTAIRLTRTSLDSDLVTYQKVKTGRGETCKKCFTKRAFFGRFMVFWRKLPRRLWSFYIESLLVPAYRKEGKWEKYKSWNYRMPSKTESHIHFRKRHSNSNRSQRIASVPHPTPHCHDECERIRINVGGILFETQLRTLERFPDTLLGNEKLRLPFYNPQTKEYYFDRCRSTFEVILYFYQSGGRFKRPDNVSSDILLEDAHFFQLSETVIDQYRSEEGLTPQTVKHEFLPLGLLKRKIWLLFDFPESSFQAKIVTSLSTFALFLSIADLCAETLPAFYLKATYGVKDDGTVMVVSFDTTNLLDPFVCIETSCNVWFICEYLIRLWACPITLNFIMNWLNLIDLVAIIPFVLTTVVPALRRLFGRPTKPVEDTLIQDDGITTFDYLYLLRVVRIVRVFRIFKLSRYFKGLKILGKTMHASMNELVLLIFFIILGVILFSSTMYFAELDDENTQFHSIPGGFWWALITLTTVGYGDYVPKSPSGKVVGALCAVAGVLVIALPVPVIVSNFNYFYHQAIDEHDLKWININHVSGCPFRPSEYKKETPHEFKKGKDAISQKDAVKKEKDVISQKDAVKQGKDSVSEKDSSSKKNAGT